LPSDVRGRTFGSRAAPSAHPTRPQSHQLVSAGRYRIVGPLAPLGAGESGVTETYEGQAAVFLKKPAAVQPPYYVAAEYVCAELARLIRLPVPPSFVAELPGEENRPAFTSLGFNLSGGATPPIDPDEAVAADPDLSTAVVLFDIWIVNTDRHRKNISFLSTRTPHRFNVFDHSHALFYHTDTITFYQNRLAISGIPDRGNRHCLLDALNTSRFVGKWLDRIRRVPVDLIQEVLADAVDLGLPEPLATATALFLIDRRDRLWDLVKTHRREFTQVADWPFV
jgi:hypothetical protein